MEQTFPAGQRIFFLRDIGEPREGVLRVAITEGMMRAPEDHRLFGEHVESRLVDVLPSSPSLELTWENYLAYAVHSDGKYIPEERPPLDAMLMERQHSRFLDYVRASSFGPPLVQNLRHWQLVCCLHVIEVASDAPPLIREVPPGTSYPLR